MRPAVVRLISAKEFRDLARDRRTVFLIFVLPLLLYGLFGVTGLVFARTLLGQPTRVGVVNLDALAAVGVPLVQGGGFADGLDAEAGAGGPMALSAFSGDPEAELAAKTVDLVVVAPATIAADLNDPAKRPEIRLLARDGDEASKLAVKRVGGILRAWEAKLRERRFERAGLAKDFDRVLTVTDPSTNKPKLLKVADELRDTFRKVIPFVLMMWLITGAIQPAVDMTAGEKERGTMETLLISPASRSEIVAGKFLATTGFAFVTVVWNVLCGGLVGYGLERLLGFPIINWPGLVGCVLIGLPQAMLFSAVCLALGVFARSTKEGQYYLVPLILGAMPLALGSMTPGVEINWLNCWLPVTGPMLFQSRLLALTGEGVPWEFLPAVLASSALWVTLALAFAVWQFNRESVLFRETGPAKRPGGFRFGRRAARHSQTIEAR